MRKQRGFAFVDVIFSVAVISLMALLLSGTVYLLQNNFKQIRSINSIASVIQNETILLEETSRYESSRYHTVEVEYQVIERLRMADQELLLLKMRVEDEENGIEKEYQITCRSS